MFSYLFAKGKKGESGGGTCNALKRIGLDGVKPVKPKSDGSETEVIVQYHSHHAEHEWFTCK